MKSVGKEMDIVHGLTSLAADCIFFVALSTQKTLPVKGTTFLILAFRVTYWGFRKRSVCCYAKVIWEIGGVFLSLLRAEAFITAIGKGSKIISQHSILSLPFLTSRLRVRAPKPL